MRLGNGHEIRGVGFLGGQALRIVVICAFAALTADVQLGAGPATFMIRGSAGAPGVTVSAGGRSTVSDTNGSYTLSGLIAGKYSVTVSKLGCSFSPSSLTVPLGPSATGRNFVANCTLSIAGNAGASGATVTAGGRSTVSDASGNYNLTGLNPGSYSIVASKSGCSFSPASIPVSLGSNTSGRNFVANCTLSIAGNAGASGATVTARFALGTKSAVADSSGQYSIDGLGPGTYAVSVYRAGCSPLPVLQPVTIGPSADGVDFSTACSSSVNGNAGASGVKITVGSKSALSNPDGTFSVGGFPDGTYSVTPTKTGCYFSPASHRVTIGPDASDLQFNAYCPVDGSHAYVRNVVCSETDAYFIVRLQYPDSYPSLSHMGFRVNAPLGGRVANVFLVEQPKSVSDDLVLPLIYTIGSALVAKEIGVALAIGESLKILFEFFGHPSEQDRSSFGVAWRDAVPRPGAFEEHLIHVIRPPTSEPWSNTLVVSEWTVSHSNETMSSGPIFPFLCR